MPRRPVYVMVAALLLISAGCASGSTSGSGVSPSGSSSPSGTASTKAVEVSVAVRDGKVTPAPHRVQVPLGSDVHLQVTSDVADEVHVHGFDVEKPVAAGRTTTIELHADQPGLFEVETHETELQLLQLEVR